MRLALVAVDGDDEKKEREKKNDLKSPTEVSIMLIIE